MNPAQFAKFLPRQAPRTASAHIIDFTTTTPSIPKYNNLFAAVIDNILTESECNELIQLAESSTITPSSPTPTWERAMINVGGGRQVLATDTRNCGRIIYDAPDIADKLLQRLMPFLRKFEIDKIDNKPRVTGLQGRGKTYTLTRLNERLRFLKYEGGEYFRPHWDGRYTTPDRKECSYYTIQLYLHGEGEQDLTELEEASKTVAGTDDANLDKSGELLGGATSFIPCFEDEETKVRVFPKTGSVLVFQQNDLMHGGGSGV
ncbi:hypothetical protein AWENTII_002986 [Aspergillus wentii]